MFDPLRCNYTQAPLFLYTLSAQSLISTSSDLHAQRLGHGYNVFSTELVMAKSDPQRFVDGLVRYCAVNRVLFEVR